MPRSSGQMAMPARAIARAGRPISSRPPNCTEPLRLPRMPMIAFSVVVLPAPLRPSRVTTSPSRTSKLIAVQHVALAVPAFEVADREQRRRVRWRGLPQP